MKSYRDLEIYQESKKLAVEVHALTLKLPKFELYEEGSQIRRSSKAVTVAIVEGFARRRYKAEYIRYLVFSLAECDETILHQDFLHETKSWTDEAKYKELRSRYDTLSKRINKFMSWVDENWEKPPDI